MKIAVIHATAGAGHKMAALAITNQLNSQGGHQVQCIDALDYTNPFFKAMYPASYVFMVTKMAWAWKFFFALLDQPALWPLMRFGRRIYNGLNTGKLTQFLIDEQFDVIFCTHFLSAEVLGYLKRNGKVKSKIICCITDFDVHRIWVNEGIDMYTAASDFTKTKLLGLGVKESSIAVTGIPVDAKFGQLPDQKTLRAKLNIQENKITVLMATGSFGIGPMAQLIKELDGVQRLVVCGHNKKLYEDLKSLQSADVHIYGLVSNMHELMGASDMMVTKPGGLSVAEALAVKLPMIFFSAIPGQETGNINVLKSYGAGDEQMPLPQIVAKIQQMAQHPQELVEWKSRLTVLSKPQAAKDIITLI